MSKMKRTLALLAVLAMASTSFVACGGDKEESKAEPTASTAESTAESKDDAASADESTDEGDATAERDVEAINAEEGTLSIVCWTDADLNNMFAQYCAERGVESGEGKAVNWVQCGTNGGEGNTQYATFLNSGEDVDLFVAEAGWILNYIETDEYAKPLSDLGIEASEYSNAYQYTVDIATNNSGNLMGASWQAAAGGFCYYTDMAEEYLGITDAAAMQDAIKDWDGFKNVAATLKDNGVTVCASLGGLWQCYSTSQDAAWTDGTTLKTDIAADFTAFAKEMVDAGYVDATIGQWEDPWFNAGNAGETFGYFFSTWCLPAEAQLQQCMGDAGNVNIVVGPSEFFWGGSWLCVSKNINNPLRAEDFIRYFTIDTASMKEYAETVGEFVNNQEAMADISFANDLLGGQDQFAVLKEVAAGIDMSDSISKYDQTLKDTFLTSLRDNIGSSADDIMADFKADAQTAIPELTVE